MTTRSGHKERQGAGAFAGGGPTPEGQPAASERVLQALSPAESLLLLEPGGIGRVGMASAEGIIMLPVNFALVGRAIVFRTAPDTLLAVHATAPMSFEADHADEELREGWSVLIQGHPHEVSDEGEVRHLERATSLEPWAGGARDVWVRITPARITGRRIQRY